MAQKSNQFLSEFRRNFLPSLATEFIRWNQKEIDLVRGQGVVFWTMLREVIEDALHRGEKLKKDIVGQVLSSAAFHELVNNKKFTDTVVKIIETKHEIAKALHRKIEEVLKVMCIPSNHDLASYQRRIEKLENQIDQLSRQSRKSARGKTHKK